MPTEKNLLDASYNYLTDTCPLAGKSIRGQIRAHPNQACQDITPDELTGQDTSDSQLEAMGLERLRARTNPSLELKVHAALLAATIANAN